MRNKKKRWYEYLWKRAMLFTTYLVFSEVHGVREIVKILWSFKVPWSFAYHGTAIAPWEVQFAFGFYSVMLTPTILGLITMVLYKPSKVYG